MAKAEAKKVAGSFKAPKRVVASRVAGPTVTSSVQFPPHLKNIGVKNAADAKKFLQDAGIITSSGKLSRNYGGSK